MIINVGGRTDIVQYFTPWLLRRFEEGYVLSRNPMFPNRVARYELTPDKVDCVMFCSKNYAPILDDLHRITDRFNTYFFYTITAYGKDVEPGVPTIEESMETLKRLSALVGKKRVVWRYDPVLLTARYTIDVHMDTFSMMCRELAPYVDRCIFSFVQYYDRVPFNMPEIIPFRNDDKERIAEGLGRIAGENGIRIQQCIENADYSKYGITRDACTTLKAVGDANGVSFKDVRHKGMRAGCRCIESRDIGWYDTCLNGCRYCYANTDPLKAFDNHRFHEMDSPLLLGHLNEGDEVYQGNQESFLRKRPDAVTLDRFRSVAEATQARYRAIAAIWFRRAAVCPAESDERYI